MKNSVEINLGGFAADKEHSWPGPLSPWGPVSKEILLFPHV